MGFNGIGESFGGWLPASKPIRLSIETFAVGSMHVTEVHAVPQAFCRGESTPSPSSESALHPPTCIAAIARVVHQQEGSVGPHKTFCFWINRIGLG